MIELARQGDQQAMEAVLRPLVEPGRRLGYALLSDHHMAEDAVQEACVKAWRKFGQFRDGSLRAWFLAIVANECRTIQRRRWWNVRKFDELPAELGGTGQEPQPDRMDLRDAIRKLPFRQRTVLYLYYCEDLSHDDIGRALHVRPGTVKSRLHRSLAALRTHLQEDDLR